jgi:hypothetical protein
MSKLNLEEIASCLNRYLGPQPCAATSHEFAIEARLAHLRLIEKIQDETGEIRWQAIEAIRQLPKVWKLSANGAVPELADEALPLLAALLPPDPATAQTNQQLLQRLADLEKAISKERSRTQWTRGYSSGYWAKIFGVGRNTMDQYLKDGTIKNRKLGKVYQIDVQEIPTDHYAEFRPKG